MDCTPYDTSILTWSEQQAGLLGPKYDFNALLARPG